MEFAVDWLAEMNFLFFRDEKRKINGLKSSEKKEKVPIRRSRREKYTFVDFNLALWLIHRKLFDKVYSGYKMSNIMFIIQATMFIVNTFVSHQRINKVESVFLDW